MYTGTMIDSLINTVAVIMLAAPMTFPLALAVKKIAVGDVA